MWLNYGVLAAICALAIAQQPDPYQSFKTGEPQQYIPGHLNPYTHHNHHPHYPPYPYYPNYHPYPYPSPQPPSPPAVDRFVCTLDATVLTVLETKPHFVPQPQQQPSYVPPVSAGRESEKQKTSVEGYQADPEVGIGIIGPCHPGMPSQRCGNAVRIRCAETAVVDALTCTTCCQLASKFEGVKKDEVTGVLIDSTQVNPHKGHVPFTYVGANNRQKRAPPETPEPPPASCAASALPCPAMKCMCCAPRLNPPHHHPHPPPYPHYPYQPYPSYFPHSGSARPTTTEQNQQQPAETK